MIPFGELVQIWKANIQIPIWVGSVPEGTAAPYASLNIVQSNPIRMSSDITAFTESLIQFVVVAEKLVDAEALGQQVLDAFDKYRSSTMLDCVYMNQIFEYASRPNLSGNRPWSSVQEYRIRH